MKNLLFPKILPVAAVAGIFVLASCSKSSDSVLSSTDSQNVNSESVSNSTANETADVSNSVMTNVSDSQLAGARVAGGTLAITGLGDKDGRLSGATITIVGTGTKDMPAGTITIDYGTGVTTNGVTRKGQIIVTYTGRRLQPNSTRVISFNGFSRNSVGVSGTYTITVSDTTLTPTDLTATFSHVTDLTLTFSDNTTITRQAAFTVVWDYVIATPTKSTITNKANGTAAGTTRKGGSYSMSITTDLVYPASCLATGYPLPQSGAKTLTVIPASSSTPNVYTLTYGNGSSGSCTNTVSVQFNGKTTTITVNANGD